MKIKLLLLSIVMLFVFGNLQANFVSKEKAAKVAVNFYYQAINAQQPVDISSIKITDTYTIAEKGISFYYVFNIKNGGFIIVSAEDAMNPILGYSFENNYSEENPSPEFTWWMSGYKDQIRYAKENKLSADAKTQAQWNEYSITKPYIKAKTDITVGPLLLTTWDQGFPYNELCPADAAGPGGHVYAGCVATAAGQVINYYKYPLQGSSSHCYSSTYGQLCSTYSDSTYKWNEMPNQLSGSNIPVASLLYQLGIAVNMDYAPDGSGAYSTSVPGALIAYFNYNGSTQIVSRSSYTQTNWENLIQQQHNLKYPLYYSGQGPSGGHAFVCDGYKVVGSTTTYHFNWGWSGSSDGYFSITNLNPGGSTFNDFQSIIINSYPASNYPYNCTGQKTFTTMNGVFEDGSGYFDYQPNLNCSWLIDPINPSGTDHITLTFDRFEMTDANDILTIYNGENASAPILATYNGSSTIPASINSTSPKVYITFTTDGAINGGGWSMSYSSNNIIHCTGTTTLTEPSFSFDDGSGSSYNYNNGSLCKWKINPPYATFVKLKFNQLETEPINDKVMIYKDFSANSGNLIGTYSGSTIPDTITSPTGRMYVIFQTDGKNTFPGWTVTYVSDGSGAGITENNAINNISIFPNPTENNVKINFTVNTLQNVQLSLLDIIGNSVYNETMTNFIGNFDKSLDLSKYAKGIYIVRIKANNNTYNQKLVIK